MLITSKDNEIVKRIKKLKDKKYRDEAKEYIIEGIKLVKEAIVEKVEISVIIVCEECEIDEKYEKQFLYDIAKYNCIYVTQSIFDSLTDVVNPQGILAVVKKQELKEVDFTKDIIVALDNIQDPANLGTILRTLDSIGIEQVVISKETIDPYNPKVVRGTMGAIFRINVIENNLINFSKEAKKQKYKIMATSLEEAESIYNVKYDKSVIIIGNESKGVSKEILDLADIKIKIPMLGKAESLNAGVATGIILYEYVRQKLLR